MMNIIYRSAAQKDSDGIVNLNHMYYIELSARSEKGFLRNKFSPEKISKIIYNDEAVVAENEGLIIGYYLVDSNSDSSTANKRKDIIQDMIKRNELEGGRYAYVTQAAVDINYMNKGVAKNLLGLLRQKLRNRFDFFIGFIDKDNINAQKAHLRSGWEIISKIENGYLARISTRSDTIVLNNTFVH